MSYTETTKKKEKNSTVSTVLCLIVRIRRKRPKKKYVPSNGNDSSGDSFEKQLIEKKKSKWFRKRIRPLKREEGRKLAAKINSTNRSTKIKDSAKQSSTNLTYSPTEENAVASATEELQQALQTSTILS